MKTFTLAASLLSLSSAAVATLSKPFYLSVQSKNATLNNKKFGTCHEGAGIESLCIYKDDVATYQFNTTDKNTYGTLVYDLVISGGGNQPSALRFGESLLSTNTLHLQFFPDPDGSDFGFDASNRLYAPVSYDDTIVPASYNKPAKLYNWYVCQFNSQGYIYETLNWVVGRGNLTPTNPTCQKVDVVRKFA